MFRLSLLLALFVYASIAVAQNKNSNSNLVATITMILFEDESLKKELTLTWQRPVMRENNEVLGIDEIAYYRLRYRNASVTQSYTFRNIPSPSIGLNLSVSGDAGDDYEFSVQAVDVNGFSSSYTEPVIYSFE